MSEVTVDLVTHAADLSVWRLVLVEQGPWPGEAIETNLRQLQNRLYSCIDAAIDGQVAELYPDSAGKQIVVRLDGYNLPIDEVRHFFERFSTAVPELPDYKAALLNNKYVLSLSFELNLEALPNGG